VAGGGLEFDYGDASRSRTSTAIHPRNPHQTPQGSHILALAAWRWHLTTQRTGCTPDFSLARGPPRKPETFLAAQGPPVASGGPFLQAQKPAKVLSPVSSSAHLPAIGRAAEKPVIPSAPFSAAYFAFWRWVLSEVAMVLLPTFCPACSGFTMKVVKYGLDDSY